MRDLPKVREILRAWGAWSSNYTGCGWYRETPYLSGVIPREVQVYHSITDEQAIEVDRIVADMMKNANSQDAGFLILHYVYGFNKSEIARLATKADKTKCSEGKVRNALMIMEAYVAGSLATSHLRQQEQQ